MRLVKKILAVASVFVFSGHLLCSPAGFSLIVPDAEFPLKEAKTAWQRNRERIAAGTECQVDVTIEARVHAGQNLVVASKTSYKFVVLGKRQLFIMDGGASSRSLEAVNQDYWFKLACSPNGDYSLENIVPISLYVEQKGTVEIQPCRELFHGTQCVWEDLDDVMESPTATWTKVRNGKANDGRDDCVEYSIQGEVDIDDYTRIVGGTIAFLDSRAWLISHGKFKAMAKSKNGIWKNGEIRVDVDYSKYLNGQFPEKSVLEFDFPEIGFRRYTYDFKDINKASAETGKFFLSDYGMREPEFGKGNPSRFWMYMLFGGLAFSAVAVVVWMRRN